MPGERMRRVNEALREVLSARIASEIKDPRVGFVTVTAVDTSPDLRHAKVYVSALGDDAELESSLEGLRSSAGRLQAGLAHEVRMKNTPTLDFEPDEALARGERISRILDEELGE